MKNHVGMDCCAICGEPKGVVLCTEYKKVNGKLEPKQAIPENFCSGPELCKECLQKMKDNNTFVIYEADGEEGKPNPRFTGRWMVVNFEAINKNAPIYNYVDKNRFILADLDEYERLLGMKNEKK